MYRDKDMLVVALEAVAAEAKLLASQVKNGQTWPGDASKGLDTIQARIGDAVRAMGSDR